MNILLPSFIKKSNALFIVFFILHYLRLYNCVIYKIQALKYLALIIDMLFSFYFLFCYIRYKKKHHVSLLEKSVSLLFLILGQFDCGLLSRTEFFICIETTFDVILDMGLLLLS